MQLVHTLEARHQQTQRVDPRQILASEILAWTTAELEVALERELAENPALELKDEALWESPALSPLASEPMPLTSTVATVPLLESAYLPDKTHPTEETAFSLWERYQSGDPEASGGVAARGAFSTVKDEDPLERLGSPISLHEFLGQQIGQVSDATIRTDILRALVEAVDERGYLTVQLDDMAERFGTSRSVVEAALQRLQMMEPAGVGARDLQECLILQAEHLEQVGEGNALATRLLRQCWDELAANREERIASRLRQPVMAVRQAMGFIRQALTPYPGLAFRPKRQAYGLEQSSPVRPDVLFYRDDKGFRVELAQDFETNLMVAPLWKQMVEKNAPATDREHRLSDFPKENRVATVAQEDSMRRYIRDHVDRASAFLNGVTRRGQTLRKVAHALVRFQSGFLETGNRAFLRPLTRQTVAEHLEMDESVISRAVSDKWAQLPGGELVSLDIFFGNAHAVRDALMQLIAAEDPTRPYSDNEIVDLLNQQGYPLARRTVAKYRSQEKILPARLRRKGTCGKPNPRPKAS